MPVRVSGGYGQCWIELKDDGRVFLGRIAFDPNLGESYHEMDELSDNDQLALEQLLKMADVFKENEGKPPVHQCIGSDLDLDSSCGE